MKKDGWLKILLVLAVFTLWVSPAGAKYPEKPISFIMPWPAGGGTDISLRPLVAAASKVLGQPMPIEYHPGGGTAVGVGLLKTKKPDGYTIGLVSTNTLMNMHTRKVPYDLFKDFAPIMQYAEYTFGLVVMADAPWKTVKELGEYARANPGKIRYSSAGPDSPQALVMASLAKHLQANMTHIPFEGGPPALTALMGRHVEVYTSTLHCKPHIQSGQLRMLATYGEKRLPSFANIPTLRELGFPLVAPSFMVVVAPKGIPGEYVEVLNQAFRKATEDAEFLKACGIVDHVPIYRGPQEITKHLLKLNEEVGIFIRELKAKK